MARLSMAGRLRRAVERDEFVLTTSRWSTCRPARRRRRGPDPLVRRRPGWSCRATSSARRAHRADRADLGVGDRARLPPGPGWRDAGLDLYVSVNLPRCSGSRPRCATCSTRSSRSGSPRPDDDRDHRVDGRMERSPRRADPAELHERGLRLAIDDFGTGHFARSAEPDGRDDAQDRPLVRRRPPERPQRRVLVKAMIRLADGLGLQALAEGIETEAQRAFLSTTAARSGRASCSRCRSRPRRSSRSCCASPSRLGQVTRFIAASSSACSPDSTMPASRSIASHTSTKRV